MRYIAPVLVSAAVALSASTASAASAAPEPAGICTITEVAAKLLELHGETPYAVLQSGSPDRHALILFRNLETDSWTLAIQPVGGCVRPLDSGLKGSLHLVAPHAPKTVAPVEPTPGGERGA